MQIRITDGGRAAAGFKGETRDCVTRAIAIATGRPYREVYDELNKIAKSIGDRSSSRTGVHRKVYEKYLFRIGAKWTPTMRVGAGCTVHLRAGELPATGALVVSLSRHLCAVVDGVVCDAFDPTRDGTRCVYGYYTVTP